jgi:PAS domain S-box-containing protein
VSLSPVDTQTWFFFRLLESTAQPFVAVNLDLRFILTNPAFSRLTGYSGEELRGMSVRDITPEWWRPSGLEAMARLHSTGKSVRYEKEYLRKDGSLVPVEAVVDVDRDDNGEIRGYFSFVTDATERKQTEAALVTSERRARALFEGIEDIVFVHDLDGKILDVNPAACRRLGYSRQELLQLKTSDLDDPEFAAGFGERLRSQLERRHVAFEGRHRNRSGVVIPVDISTSLIQFEDQVAVLAVCRDITERKTLEAERQKMRAMLAQTEKLASIGLLSAGVAHEINNPLAYVANNLAVLERDFQGILAMMKCYDEGHDQLRQAAPALLDQIDELSDDLDWPYVRSNLERMLTRTREGVQRVANIVQNLRGLARTSAPKMEPVSIPELISPAIEMVQGRIKRRGVELVQTHESPRRVLCVPSQISQVVLNLLVNAIQAIETSGREQGGRIEIRTGVEGEFYAIDISDDGSGIDAESIPKLFDPFFTTKPVGEGTGLGLSISHGIITGHGGRIDVDSQPGQGTRFRILLPLSQAI